MSITLISSDKLACRAIQHQFNNINVPATLRKVLFVVIGSEAVVPKHCTNVLFSSTVTLNARVEVMSGVRVVRVAT